MGMVDVTEKRVVRRSAQSTGRIRLSSDTIDRIRNKGIKKGDPLTVAEIAAMNAAKQTHLLIPHCHQIPLDSVDVTFDVSDGFIDATCEVKAQARTGVEMEALVGVTMALNTIWDMVKYLEKDEHGQYPSTEMRSIRVVRKDKSA